jgi:HEAT repeat protein
MARRLSTEAALAALSALGDTAPEENVEPELRRLLSHKSNYVVAKAVALVQERRAAALAPELIAAFAYFMADPIARDPGCSAKLAIVSALSAFAEPAWEVYLAGVCHVQKEPAWGGPIDTAATLRGNCGRALMGLGHHDAFRWHAVLMADSEPMTRALAVETLGSVYDERAEILLRAKIAREPDTREPERGIEMDAFEALMRIAPEASFDFVAGHLRDDDLERVRGAALALAGTHSPEAFAALRERWIAAARRETREALALPIALVRSDEAFAFLLDALVEARMPLAGALMEALGLFRESPSRSAAVQRILDKRGDPALRQCLRQYFDGGLPEASGGAA